MQRYVVLNQNSRGQWLSPLLLPIEQEKHKTLIPQCRPTGLTIMLIICLIVDDHPYYK
jgi:hypothetical protein